jgi:hypothetical protein
MCTPILQVVWLPHAPCEPQATRWLLQVFKNSIMLTHWGRMDLEHQSNTAYGYDK